MAPPPTGAARLPLLAALAGLLLGALALPEILALHVAMVATGQRAGLVALFLGLVVVTAGGAAFGARLLHRRVGAALARRIAGRDLRTGLAGEAECRDRLEEALSLATRQGWHVGVLVLDIRQFRLVNETLGRAGGDAVLELVGARLRQTVRREDTVARLGADRFAVVQTALPEPEGAMRLASRLLAAMSRPFLVAGQRLDCALDIGLAIAPGDGAEAGVLLARAEGALADARARPEAGVCCFEPAQDTALRRRRALEQDLRQAIAEGQFLLHYQPQRRLSDGRLVGFEALLRWPHPERGMVPPDEFIPIAEASGLIVPLGAWVVRAACAEASAWPGGIGVAVNLSPAQFRHGGLVATVAEALAQSGLPAHRLELEVTESLLQRDLDSTERLLRDLRDLGVGIAMDDFGTGWSSLAHLWRFPFGKLKVDRAFLRDLPEDRRVQAIVATILGLGRTLDMVVVAEGVETEQQAEWLRAQGCAEGQGWLFGRPMPPAQARALIEAELGTRQPAHSAAQA
ncbi:putative bifunctional diguanylate cyclase/phosphodiesterase [Falsiroseomonas sp. CW058]|uniref:putative bifunctional diguanylate cyclase/phosphodiesterase n=1 Tax=Falsiroseomonas sp. CW058 TaxID=3388664 RepID=UPI003D324621